ncbi:MAG: NifB/NifX family molybdenum-iron cluster-binding protein [Candidatus Aureabacteria bacterium]|nr:NifB/NifX family molybdenum-iron cluster-binding protein [Candidatus Auribacterota bacterium]
MKRIAISTDGDIVSAHFGRCPSFTIFDTENGRILKKEIVSNPGHHPGAIPQFMHQNGVDCIIAGGMGMRAAGFFQDFGIQTIVGMSGKINDVIDQFVQGKLRDGESLCRPGSGKGYGLDKTECDHGNEKKLLKKSGGFEG